MNKLFIDKENGVKEYSGILAKLVRYFHCQVIGSYLFVFYDYMDYRYANDIDIQVIEQDVIPMRHFLIDAGYTETRIPYEMKGYGRTEGSLLFEKEGELPIHLCKVSKLEEVYSIEQLAKSKIARGERDDYSQLLVVISEMQTRLEKKMAEEIEDDET